MFENKIIRNIHTSRYIMSYVRAGGTFTRKGCYKLKAWLESLVIDGKHLTEDEVAYITRFADNGKLELEANAEKFLTSNI